MKILVVEDHSLMRDALSDLVKRLKPNVRVVEANNSSAALTLAGENADADLLILDLLLPGQDANEPFQTLKALREQHEEIPVVVYSGKVDKETVQTAIDMGAMGFIPKSTDTPKILEALKSVLNGMIYLPPEVYHRGENAFAPPPAPGGADPLVPFKLTPRDREVLALVVQGKSDKVVARKFGIGVQNVKNRVKAIREKFEAVSRAELIFKLWKMHVRLEHILKGK